MYIIQTNCSTKAEAKKIGMRLVELRLAASINYWQVSSIYHFEGRVSEDIEWRLMIKTVEIHKQLVIDEIGKLHSYKNPVIWGNEVVSDENTQNWLVANINNTNV